MKKNVSKVFKNLSEPAFEKTQSGKAHMQWVAAVLLNTTCISYGMVIAWPASVANVLQSANSPTGYPLSTLNISWLTSSPNLSAMLGIPLWTFLVDRFGRKPCITMCAVLLTINWLLIMVGRNLTTLMIGRMAGGVAGGGCIYVVPIYIKELSQDNIRGILGMMWNITRSLGILAMYVMAGYLSYYTILWVTLVVSAISILAVLLPPESPTYYVKSGKYNMAAKTIASMRSLKVENKVVQDAIESIEAEDERFKSLPSIGLLGIFRERAWWKGFVFMIPVMICHGLNGGLSIVNYAPTILKMFGVTVNSELLSISIPIFMMIGCILSMTLIERLGRKPILGFSFLLSMISFVALAVFLLLQQSDIYIPSWIYLCFVVVPVCTFAAAISPVPIVILAEMFNFQIRAKVVGCLGMVGWGCAFIQTLIFGPMTATFGPHAIFLFFAAVSLCGTLSVLLLLPETKMKSVEQIELELAKKFEK